MFDDQSHCKEIRKVADLFKDHFNIASLHTQLQHLCVHLSENLPKLIQQKFSPSMMLFLF